MTRQFIVRLATSVYALFLALSLTIGHAAGPDCRRGIPSTRDCPGAISSPPGLPSHGGTVTVHPGISLPCIVLLPGGAKLCAGGETAAPYGLPGAPSPPGRAIFRVSGNSLDTPGINIVVSRSGNNAPNGPELLPQLAADAVVLLPPDAVLLRFEAESGRYVLVPNGHIRQAGDTLYKVLRRGAAPAIAPATPLPAVLPATGSSPFGALFAVEALLVIAGVAVARGILPRFDPSHAARRIQRRVGLAMSVAGLVLAAATGTAFAALSGQQPSGFGTLAQAQGPTPRGVSAPGPPTRLVIARLGIDTAVIPLRVVDGAWQTPTYAAGYLAGAGMAGSANEVITGHDDRDGAVFRRLGELRAGDTVQVFTGSHRYRYTVTALRAVPANRVDVLRPTRQAVLTLVTCTPYLVDTQRLVARATLLAQG